MKAIKYLIVGFVFGIVLTKSEAVSWYRIYEMFRFDSFHMYGIIFSAIAVGFLGLRLIRQRKMGDIKGNTIEVPDKERGSARYWIGGIVFGLGWGLAGTCPGPIFILLGAGFISVAIVLAGALIGTFLYGMIKNYLPH